MYYFVPRNRTTAVKVTLEQRARKKRFVNDERKGGERSQNEDGKLEKQQRQEKGAEEDK